MKDNVVFQDNQSAILLEKNGQRSSGKRTRHLNIRYFFITDRVNKNEATIKYCPTEDMLGDFFTKPLQGALFRKLRAMIMNLPMGPDETVELQECVADAGQTQDPVRTYASVVANRSSRKRTSESASKLARL